MRIRRRSIRASIVALVLPPLVFLIALWLFATSLTLPAATNLLATGTSYQEAGRKTEALLTELQRERKLSMSHAGSGRVDPRAMQEQRPRTDAVADRFRALAASETMREIANAETRVSVTDMVAGLNALAAGRGAIDTGRLDRPGVMQLYGVILDAGYRLYASLPGIEDRMVSRDSRTLIALSRAREVLAQEDAFLSGVAAAGRFTGAEPGQLAQLVGIQRFLFAEAVPLLPGNDRDAYRRAFATESAVRLRALEDRLTAEARPGAAVPIDMNTWRATYDQVTTDLRAAEFAAADGVVARGTPVGMRIILRLVFAGLLGLLAVLVSVIVSIRVGRSIVRRLTGLRRAAQELAGERLPSVVARLRAGEPVDVAAETPSLELGNDEIGEVGRAFAAVQRTAVESAVQEARLRAGFNNVFLNIARRSQTLLHRQLTLLDRMERRTGDPEELEDLFRVDHLATRMRRHAEDLVIIAGSAPGRGWRNPVPVVDVVRGAVSEVEDYARVAVAVPDAAVAGRAVADIIHLLAELIENATSFSPPHTRVQVGGDVVPNGLVVEIEDRGLGMSAEDLAEANRRLSGAPEFDPSNSARLGLLVVSILAARHGVRVTLRPSPYGGVTAIVLIPPDLVVTKPVPAIDAEPTHRGDRVLSRVGPVPQLGGTAADRPGAAADRPGAAADRPGADRPASGTGSESPVRQSGPEAPGRGGPGDDRDAGADLPMRRGTRRTLPEPTDRTARHTDPAPTGRSAGPPATLPSAPPTAASTAPTTGWPDLHGTPPVDVRPVDVRPVDVPPVARIPGPRRPPEAATPTGTAAHGDDDTGATGSGDGLPRRRRQASLPAQLRAAEPPPAGPSTMDGVDAPPVRTPEEIRAMMASLQAGMLRGRQDAEGLAGARPADPTPGGTDSERGTP